MSILLRNVRPLGGSAVDLAIRDGRFVRADGLPPDAEVIDAGGALAIPGLVEAHTHLDKTLIGMPWWRNDTGPTREAADTAAKAVSRGALLGSLALLLGALASWFGGRFGAVAPTVTAPLVGRREVNRAA